MFTAMIMVAGLALAQTPDILSVEEVCRAYPERIARLFDALNLDRPGLQAVRTSVAAKDWPKAADALLDHYRTGETAIRMRVERKPTSDDRDPAGDEILDDVYTLYDIKSKVPRRPDGGLDWTFNGPSGDKEWGWGLNRQPWIQTLVDAYSRTGNAVYVRALDKLLQDWVISNPYPGVMNRTPQWRGLEVFMRIANNWPTAFFGLCDFPEFSPGTRLLMLSSIPDHAHYNRNFHSDHGNWITMELRGLASAAAYWPEFTQADEWFSYAVDRMTPELTKQVYPDGAQKELTIHYHIVTLRSFAEFAKLAAETGRKLPPEYTRCVERMVDYAARTMTPSGMSPLNNDSDLDCVRDVVLGYAETCKRPDWAYIANNGATGALPEGLPSAVFPWAGQMVMRNDWNVNAQWAFFDIGPLGIGHWHMDKLHLSVSAGGRDILVDGGRYTYQSGPWRKYFVGSESHNVVLIDGHGQKPSEKEVSEPISGDCATAAGYDFARGSFTGGYDGVEGMVTHERSVLYVHDKYWVVLDRVLTDRPHDVTALWHFQPECTVRTDGSSVASADAGKGNVRIAPSENVPWAVEMIKGREEPAPQGWWSRKYNSKESASCAAYTTKVEKAAVFAWLITPSNDAAPAKASIAIEKADDEAVLIRVDAPGEPVKSWRIPLKRGDLRVE